MKKAINNYTFILGVILFVGGLLLYGLGKFEIVDITNLSKLPILVIVIGIGFIVGGACEVFIKSSREMQVEAKDERNITIGKTAKSFGFDVMTTLISITMLILVLFDFITIGAFFALFVVYVVSQIAFILKLWYLQKKM